MVRCPYCHDALEKEDLPVRTCEGCDTRFHRVCLEELGRCSVMGCPKAEGSAEPIALQEILLEQLFRVQSLAYAPSSVEAREALAEVAHLESLLGAEESERVRERARKLRPVEYAQEQERRIQEQVDEDYRRRPTLRYADDERDDLRLRKPTVDELVLLVLAGIAIVVIYFLFTAIGTR